MDSEKAGWASPLSLTSDGSMRLRTATNAEGGADVGRAIPFVETTPDGRFVVCEEATKVIDAIPAPIGVICIVGMYRFVGIDWPTPHFLPLF